MGDRERRETIAHALNKGLCLRHHLAQIFWRVTRVEKQRVFNIRPMAGRRP